MVIEYCFIKYVSINIFNALANVDMDDNIFDDLYNICCNVLIYLSNWQHVLLHLLATSHFTHLITQSNVSHRSGYLFIFTDPLP